MENTESLRHKRPFQHEFIRRKKSPNPGKEMSSTEIRTAMMTNFATKIERLAPTLERTRSEIADQRPRPLITAFVSLWEENDSMITTKMFGESMVELRRQAQASSIDLDFIIVANNGGGKTAELGQAMTARLRTDLQKTFGRNTYHEATSQPPDASIRATTPWEINIPLASKRKEVEDRCFFITQPRHDLNAGQLRAIRDISHLLDNAIMDGYAPDALFRMDAETILKYRPSSHKFSKEPLRALYDALKRRNKVVAISTKNHFEKINPDTGKPTPAIAPISYASIMEFDRGGRENFISFYGGSILAEPDFYTAGMSAITDVTCGNISDDFPLTQLLRAHAGTQDPKDAIRVNSTWAISHLNRYPDDPKMQKQQLTRWKEQGNATDRIFPDLKPDLKPSGEFLLRTVRSRKEELRHLDKKDRRRQIAKDVREIPPGLTIALKHKSSDPINGRPTWRHYK